MTTTTLKRLIKGFISLYLVVFIIFSFIMCAKWTSMPDDQAKELFMTNIPFVIFFACAAAVLFFLINRKSSK